MKNLIPLYIAFYGDLLRLLPLFHHDSSAPIEETTRQVRRKKAATKEHYIVYSNVIT